MVIWWMNNNLNNKTMDTMVGWCWTIRKRAKVRITNQKGRSLKQIGFFLLYTFSITWLSWLIIIIGNKYFNFLLYGEPLFWIPYIIGVLAPAISSYIIYRQFNEDFIPESFVKYVFGRKIDKKAWLIFGLFTISSILDS